MVRFCFRLDYQRMKFGWGVGVLYNGIKFVGRCNGFLVQPFLTCFAYKRLWSVCTFGNSLKS